MNWLSTRLGSASLVVSVVIGAACGSDARTPTAAATPTPLATPAPSPSATPQAFTCHLPALVDSHEQCPKLNPQLLDYVNEAIGTVQQTRPELFDFRDALGGSVRVLDRSKYQAAVVAAINARGGVCAKDDNEEIALKVSNDFNEQFNIWSS